MDAFALGTARHSICEDGNASTGPPWGKLTLCCARWGAFLASTERGASSSASDHALELEGLRVGLLARAG
jgi:hypothetical protein